MKKISWIILVVLCIVLFYYLLIRSFEFQVKFKANTLPGDLIETIRIWNRSLDKGKVLEVDSFNTLKQNVIIEDRSYILDWHFTYKDDSVTLVDVRVSEPNREIVNKLLVPFIQQKIEKDAADIVKEFYEALKVHLSITKVTIVGATELDSVFCACRLLETNQIEKANGMMKDYPILTSFINEFRLRPNGSPMIRIETWKHSAGLLKYYFCFPILPSDSLPKIESVFFMSFPKQKVLRANYNGNYVTSDRAWYELINFAEKRGYPIKPLPIEYFIDNPSFGVNEKEWRAEIYMPLN